MESQEAGRGGEAAQSSVGTETQRWTSINYLDFQTYE